MSRISLVIKHWYTAMTPWKFARYKFLQHYSLPQWLRYNNSIISWHFTDIYYCKFLIQHTNLLCLQWSSNCSIDVGHVNLKSSKWQIRINCRFPIWRNDLHRFHFKLWITVLWKHCDLHSPARQKLVHQNMIILMYSPQLPVAPISQSLCKPILQKPKVSKIVPK